MLSSMLAAVFAGILNGGFPIILGEVPGTVRNKRFSGRKNDNLKGMGMDSHALDSHF
jgi:hypothetical protein